MAEADTIQRVAAKVLTLADLELDTLRALNAEYLRHHPEEVAAFLNERSPEDTALLLARAPTPIAAAQILERLNPRVAGEVLMLLDDVLVRAMLAVTNPAKAAPIIGGLDPLERENQLARLDELLHRITDDVKTIEFGRVCAVRCGATAMAVAGASRSVPPTTLFGSAATIPAAMRYFASGGWVHS